VIEALADGAVVAGRPAARLSLQSPAGFGWPARCSCLQRSQTPPASFKELWWQAQLHTIRGPQGGPEQGGCASALIRGGAGGAAERKPGALRRLSCSG